ncbi:Methyl-accepting chemotaxis protein II [Gemmata sp. SH-PL17]|uniref:methyl-accepting chemotaxis protein n=1 Tax=Gemmata sp. SH-PL17 TaxID=1630693 RepID=UPI0004B01C29|nr:methyl-accepting chemotaxis protein [Gemmata sp. SH-PL17]AMV27431.1 Methyl-accepting chemotaxis protein II [Gemmata sp. SH-PL17]
MLPSILSQLAKVRIGPRLMGGFLVLAITSAVLGYMALNALADVRKYQVNAATNLIPSVMELDKGRVGSLMVQRGERTALFCAQRKDENGTRGARGRIDAGMKTMDEGLKRYAAYPMIDKEAALWKKTQVAVTEWKREVEQVLAAIDRGDLEKGAELLPQELNAANRMNELLDEHMHIQEECANQETTEADALYTGTRTTLQVVIAGTVLVALGFGFVLTVSIARPLVKMQASLAAVSTGDLTQRVDADGADEIAQMATTLNATVQGMRTALQQDKVNWEAVGKQRAENADYVGQIVAIGRAQATIEFKLDGTITNANENFQRTMGYTLPEVQGRHHSMFVESAFATSPEYRDLWSRLNRGEPVIGDFKRVGKGGKEVWLQASYNPILDLNGKPYKVVKFATDITAAKNMEQQVKEDAAELKDKVATIMTAVRAVAAGDFTQQAPDLGNDQVGQMAAALNKAVVSVRTALEGVREVSEQLADASGQLSAASDEISTGAQEQASSLEETASTLEEITATVRQNSDSAQQARQLASTSRDVAEKGGQVVGHAVDAMSEINGASKKIADIITTIDEIAFQTNLLALNAAVEAARAGEQGRGFAVVASEVRNLAQRSATSAKEIKSLIEDSVKKVDAGTELVNQSGSTLGEIVTSVKRVTDIITEIAAAGKEQSVGIEQVNKAVSQMDSVTQKNASQTEEMSATAQTLTDQAAQLRDLVARFKLSESGRTAPRPAPRSKAPTTRPRPAVTKALKNGRSNGNGRGHELDRLGSGDHDGFTEF